MTIAALITEGIGPGGSILYVMTGGLDIGAFVDIWTKDAPLTPSWSTDGSASGGWIPDAILTPGWTNS
jgi:hypothetical protein